MGVQEAFASIRSGVEELNHADLWPRSNAAALDDARTGWLLVQRMEATYAALVLDLESRVLPDGVTTRAFLRSALRRTTAQTAADVRAARNPLRRSDEAFKAGEISRAHVDVIVKTVERIPEELKYREVPKLPEFDTDAAEGDTVTVIEAVDAFFAVRARQYDSYQLQCLAKALLAALNPNADDGFDETAYDRRTLTHTRDDSGMWCGYFNLDAVNGAVFAAAIDHFSAPHPTRKEQADDGTMVEIKDTRTPAQRRADAAGLIARLAMGAAEAGTKGGEPPRIVLYTGVEDYADTHCTNSTHTTPQPPPPQQPTPERHTPERSDPEPHSPERPDPERGSPEPRSPSRSASEKTTLRPTGPESATWESTAPEPAAPESTDPEGAGPGSPSAGLAFRGRVHGATDTHLGAIGPRLLARFSCDAVLQVALMHPTGAVLDLGRDARTVTSAQRRALSARDRGCVIPGCSAPAAWCDGHHVTWWEKGGLTNLDNLALLCTHHHTLVHLGVWELRMSGGIPWARPARGIDAQRRWIRNTYYEDLDVARGLGTQMRLDPPDREAGQDEPPADGGT